MGQPIMTLAWVSNRVDQLIDKITNFGTTLDKSTRAADARIAAIELQLRDERDIRRATDIRIMGDDVMISPEHKRMHDLIVASFDEFDNFMISEYNGPADSHDASHEALKWYDTMLRKLAVGEEAKTIIVQRDIEMQKLRDEVKSLRERIEAAEKHLKAVDHGIDRIKQLFANMGTFLKGQGGQ